MNKSNRAVSNRIGDESIEEKAAARILNLGLDLHYRQVTTGMQEDGGRIKPLGKMCYERFVLNDVQDLPAQKIALILLNPLDPKDLIPATKAGVPGGNLR